MWHIVRREERGRGRSLALVFGLSPCDLDRP